MGLRLKTSIFEIQLNYCGRSWGTKSLRFKGQESDRVAVSNQFIVVNLKVDEIKPEF